MRRYLLGIPFLFCAAAFAEDLSAVSESSSGLAPVTPRMVDKSGAIPKAALTNVLGSRATVDATGPMYGGFAIATSADVYIIVRGNSLGTMGITQFYLDAPRVRIYNSAGADIIFDSGGQPGFNACSSSGQFSGPVYAMYAARGEPPHIRDTCTAHNFSAGVYTFSVTPTSGQSSPAIGEVLFEISLNP